MHLRGRLSALAQQWPGYPVILPSNNIGDALVGDFAAEVIGHQKA
jgi:hypothetical protein